jgi:hypothetical protein
MSSGSGPSQASADAAFTAALLPSRSLLFYTLTATLPIIVITVALLFLRLRPQMLMFLSIVGAAVSAGALGRILMDLTMDIAGYPDYKLPVWAVFYLIAYVTVFFTFVYFAMHLGAPGVYFGGISESNPRVAFVDSLYMSLANYINAAPDPTVVVRGQTARYLAVLQGFLSMFINVVIITKFVNSF